MLTGYLHSLNLSIYPIILAREEVPTGNSITHTLTFSGTALREDSPMFPKMGINLY